jgi:hypothetical protein
VNLAVEFLLHMSRASFTAAAFGLQQFHLGEGDIAVKTNIGIGLGRAAAQVAITGVIQSRSLFRASSSRGAVSDQAGTR